MYKHNDNLNQKQIW